MTIQTHPSFLKSHLLTLALISSLVLHTLFFVLTPHWNIDAPAKKIIFSVELQKKIEPPKPLEPIAPQPTPEPPKPKKVIKPKPQIKQPTPAVFAPSDVKAPPPTAAPVIPDTPHEVIAVAPKADSQPISTVAAAPAVPTQSNEPSEEDIDGAKARYGKQVSAYLRKHINYPTIAVRRNMQGTVYLNIEIDSDGKVIKCEIEQSSGYDVLDKSAMETVTKNGAFPIPESILRGRTFSLKHQPMTFTLAP